MLNPSLHYHYRTPYEEFSALEFYNGGLAGFLKMFSMMLEYFSSLKFGDVILHKRINFHSLLYCRNEN